MRILSERLRILREEKGLSQSQLAQLTGISNASISRWEAGICDILSDYVIILCKFFDVSADYLLGIKDY